MSTLQQYYRSLFLCSNVRARVCSMPLPPLKLVLLIQLYSTVRTSPWHGAHLLISHKPEVFSYSNIRANFIMLPSSYCVCLLSGILSTQIDIEVQIDGNTGTIWNRMLMLMLMHCQVLRIGKIMFSGVPESVVLFTFNNNSGPYHDIELRDNSNENNSMVSENCGVLALFKFM